MGRKEQRKVYMKGKGEVHLLENLGRMGMVGWSIVIPSFLGILIGFWLDRRMGGGHRCALAGFSIGLAIGCLNVLFWAQKEYKAINGGDKNKHD